MSGFTFCKRKLTLNPVGLLPFLELFHHCCHLLNSSFLVAFWKSALFFRWRQCASLTRRSKETIPATIQTDSPDTVLYAPQTISMIGRYVALTFLQFFCIVQCSRPERNLYCRMYVTGPTIRSRRLYFGPPILRIILAGGKLTCVTFSHA